jgi:hypothetical protein
MCPFEWARKKIHKEYFEMRRNLIITILASSLIGLVAWSQFSGVPESVESIDLAESAYERVEFPDFPADGKLFADEFQDELTGGAQFYYQPPLVGRSDELLSEEQVASIEAVDEAQFLNLPPAVDWWNFGALQSEEQVASIEAVDEAQFLNLPPAVDWWNFGALQSEEQVLVEFWCTSI